MRSQQTELHHLEVVRSEREDEECQYEEEEEEEEEQYESECEEYSEEHESNALCFTPEVSDELSELVDREIIPCLVPSVRGMERRRHQLEQLASCITEAIRCVNDHDDDHFPSTMDTKTEEQNYNTNNNICYNDGYGDIRFFIFGSVNMRTVLPDGDNDVTIEVDGLLSPHKTNQIVYPPNPLLVTPVQNRTNEQSSLLTEHWSSEQLSNKQSNSNHESLCQAVTEDAKFTSENNRRLSHDTTTNTNNTNNSNNKNVNGSNKKNFANIDDVSSANTSVLPVTTDSNAANVDGSLQLGTLADGRPIYAPPAALTIAGNELLSKVRDYLVREQQHEYQHEQHEHHDSHDSNVAVHSHHPLDEYAGVNGPTYFSNTKNSNNSSNTVMTPNELDTAADVYEEIKENHNITNVADNHKPTCSETHSNSNYVDSEHDRDVYDHREQRRHSSNSICKCKKIPEIFVEAFVPAEVRVLKVVMEGCSYDLTINQFGGVNCVRFLHEMDRLIGHAHLLKRTLLLLKSWASYEAHILGGQGGYLSSYAVTIMLIALLNTVDFVEDEKNDDFRVTNTQTENGATYNTKQTANSDKITDNKEEEIACDHNSSTTFHNSSKKKTRKCHTNPHTHHGKTTSITPLKLIARFIKFYRYFDYDTYCVTAFGALKLSVLSEHINNKLPLDLSCLESSVTMENHSRTNKNTEVEHEEATATERNCKTTCQLSDKLNNQPNARINVSVCAQNKNNNNEKNNSSHYEETSYDVLHANTNKISKENTNYLDMNDLGLTSEGKELFRSLIRRRTPPLFTVQEIKYLLHEMNTERESERWNWFTSTHSHVMYGKVFDIQEDKTYINNNINNNVNNIEDNSANKRNSDNVKKGIELSHSNTTNNNISESIHEEEYEKGQAIIQHSTPMEEHHHHGYDEDNANVHSGWVKRAAVDDKHLICPSCNVLLFPIRSMNVLDPLRWSSNMVRGICRNHAQRILKAFSEGLTRFARASNILRRSHMRRTMCEPVHSNNEDTSHYNGTTLQTVIATPTTNTEMKSTNMTSAISNMESTSNLSNKSTSINDHTHSSVLEQADMRWHSENSYHSCSNHSKSSSNNINDNDNNDANLPTLQCTEAERKVLQYLFGNTIHMIHKYSDVNFPWDNLNHAVAEAEHELQSKCDNEEKSSQNKEENYNSETTHHDESEHGKGEVTNNGAVKNLSSHSCQTCFIPSILCVPDISCMCAAQCVFTNPHNSSKSTQLYGTENKETVATAKDILNREVTSSDSNIEWCKQKEQGL